MNKEQKKAYEDPEVLIEILQKALAGKKFKLQCNHFITFNTFLGNDLTVYNGKKLSVICAQCGY